MFLTGDIFFLPHIKVRRHTQLSQHMWRTLVRDAQKVSQNFVDFVVFWCWSLERSEKKEIQVDRTSKKTWWFEHTLHNIICKHVPVSTSFWAKFEDTVSFRLWHLLGSFAFFACVSTANNLWYRVKTCLLALQAHLAWNFLCKRQRVDWCGRTDFWTGLGFQQKRHNSNNLCASSFDPNSRRCKDRENGERWMVTRMPSHERNRVCFHEIRKILQITSRERGKSNFNCPTWYLTAEQILTGIPS